MAWLNDLQLKKFKRVGRQVRISDEALIYGAENIEIGNNVRIDAQTLILAHHGSLKIGSHLHIASRVMLSCRGGIVIGDFSAISMGAMLISASDDPTGNFLVGPVHPEYLTKVYAAPIILEPYAWLGTSSVVLPGARIGQGAVVGAMSLVKTDARLEPWKIHVGQPAKPVKERSQDIVLKSREAIEYWADLWHQSPGGPK